MIIPLLLIIITGIGSYFIAHQWAVHILSENPSDINLSDNFNRLVFSVFKTVFAILSATVVLPAMIYRLTLNQSGMFMGWKGFFILEGTGVLLSFLLTPPDIFSTLLFLGAWQLPVLVNVLVILKKKRAVNQEV